MKRFQSMRFENVPVVVDVICNKCGKTCRPHAHAVNFEHAAVDVCWGYDSGKDTRRDHWDVCETCYDEIVASFTLPPTRGDYMGGNSWGEYQGEKWVEAPYEQTGFLREIPLYPAISPDRANTERFMDFRRDVERKAEERGYQEGATRMAFGLTPAALDLIQMAVSHQAMREDIAPDQKEQWLDLDDKLILVRSQADGRRPPGDKDRPVDEEKK